MDDTNCATDKKDKSLIETLAEQEKLNKVKYSKEITKRVLSDLEKYPAWEWESRWTYSIMFHEKVPYKLYITSYDEVHPFDISGQALTCEDKKEIARVFHTTRQIHCDKKAKEKFDKDLSDFLKKININEI